MLCFSSSLFVRTKFTVSPGLMSIVWPLIPVQRKFEPSTAISRIVAPAAGACAAAGFGWTWIVMLPFGVLFVVALNAVGSFDAVQRNSLDWPDVSDTLSAPNSLLVKVIVPPFVPATFFTTTRVACPVGTVALCWRKPLPFSARLRVGVAT